MLRFYFVSLICSFTLISAQKIDSTHLSIKVYDSIGSTSRKDSVIEIHRRSSDIVISDKKRIRSEAEEKEYQRLRHKVIKLYPYALMAKQILLSTEQEMSKMTTKKEKRLYRKSKEKNLRDRFENEIRSLYSSDGPILVKLIHRETGKTCHDILKEMKGGINTWIYQFVAKRYGFNLKETYDPSKDVDIENMVQYLKSEGQLPVYSSF